MTQTQFFQEEKQSNHFKKKRQKTNSLTRCLNYISRGKYLNAKCQSQGFFDAHYHPINSLQEGIFPAQAVGFVMEKLTQPSRSRADRPCNVPTPIGKLSQRVASGDIAVLGDSSAG